MMRTLKLPQIPIGRHGRRAFLIAEVSARSALALRWHVVQVSIAHS